MITLVIIGVIAAITVPSLINKTNNQEYVSKLKKAYSTLSQATNQIIAEEGTPRADKGGWASSVDNIYNLYKKHLNISKDCGALSGCFKQLDNKGYKQLNGDYCNSNWNTNSNYRKFILNDGQQVIIAFWSNNCSSSGYGSNNICGTVEVDVNGQKKPNTFGRDLFAFIIKENGLYPAGCDSDTRCIANSDGHGCACKVLREGAMNY